MYLLLLVFTLVLCKKRPMKVIIDTDIAQDIDDSWAVALAMQSPDEIEILMILTAARNTVGRAQVTCKFLEETGRTDLAVGIGKKYSDYTGPLYDWAKDYDLDSYPGTLYKDGVAAAADMLMKSTEDDPIYILEIAPMTNMKELIDRFPEAAKKVEGIIGLAGAINTGHRTYNPGEDIPAAQATFAYPWRNGNMEWANQDITWNSQLLSSEEDYANLLKVNDTKHSVWYKLLENYVYWAPRCPWGKWDPFKESSVIYDAVAAYFAVISPEYSKHGLVTEYLPVYVNGTGWTVVDTSRPINAQEGIMWIDGALAQWKHWVVEILSRTDEEVLALKEKYQN